MTRSSTILALDGSTEALSVALLDCNHPDQAREYFEIAPRAHASRLLPIARELLDEQDLQLADLSAIAFGRGPGAFTGLRIASGLVQGLASGAGCPVVAVSTLAALAARALAADARAAHVRVVQDARMGEIYTADFSRDGQAPRLIGEERVIEPAAIEPPEYAAMGFAGNGWHLVDAQVAAIVTANDCVLPHALDIARLAVDDIRAGRCVAADQALPVYVRDDVARKPSVRPAAEN